MTTHSRIAAFLSTSALCLGLAAAPAAFAADATAKPGETKSQMEHGQTPQGRQDLGQAGSRQPAAAKSDKMDKTDKAGAMTPATTPVQARATRSSFAKDSDAAPSPPETQKPPGMGAGGFFQVSRHNRYASTSLARTRCPKRGRAEPASPVRSGARATVLSVKPELQDSNM